MRIDAVKGMLQGKVLGMTYETRFHADDRRLGWFDIFPITSALADRKSNEPAIKDVNIIRIPKAGTITAWHRHMKQIDYWFVIQGQLQVGLAFVGLTRPDSNYAVYDYTFTFLSPETRQTLEIPPPAWHGYKSLVDDTILVYGLTNRYVETPDEIRCHVDDMLVNGAPINWNLGAR